MRSNSATDGCAGCAAAGGTSELAGAVVPTDVNTVKETSHVRLPGAARSPFLAEFHPDDARRPALAAEFRAALDLSSQRNSR